MINDENKGRIRPLGLWLLVALGVVIVTIAVVGIMNSGIRYSIPSDTNSGNSNQIDINKLHDIPDEAKPTPVKYHNVLQEPQLLTPNPIATPTPIRQRSALELWREQEEMKAREAPVMVPGFGNSNTKEIASQNTDKLNHYHVLASPYTLMEGTYLTAILLMNINSDYPGPIIAQIFQSVFDTGTGRYLLIPPGAKLIGYFDSPSGPLQERITIKWHRIIFPDTSSFDLPEMPSLDKQGYGGMTGNIDHHYVSATGAILVTSILGLGSSVGSVLAFNSAQTSPYEGGVYQTNPEQQLAMQGINSMGAQASNTTSRYFQPYLNRKNTISIRAGTVFNIFCTQDLVFPDAYQNKVGSK